MSPLSAGKPINLDKRSKILLGVLAAVVVVAGAFFLLKGGSSSSDDTANRAVPIPTRSAAAHLAKPSITPTPKASASPSAAAQGSSTRDPFLPLVDEAAATTTAAPTSSPSSATASATPTPSASPSASSSSGSHTVNLISIHGTQAVLAVDGGADNSVGTGTDLGNGIAVIKITDDSVFVTYANKAYALAPGQTVSV